MIEKIKEKNVWDTLRTTPLPIVLYGMGNGADMVIDELHKTGRDFDDIFAGDRFVRGQIFHGRKVKTYKELCEEYDDFFVVMCFAVHDDETIDFAKLIAKNHPFAAPNVPIVNDGVFTREYIELHDKEFDEAYALLADEESRRNYINILNFKVSGKIDYLFASEKEKRSVYNDVLKLTGKEIFVDLGAYDGDTINELISITGGYEKIFAFEADSNNFKKLQKNTERLHNVELYNLAAWDKKDTLLFEKKKGRNSKLSQSGNIEIPADSVDNIIKEPFTVLKMDIEGSEEKAIAGAERSVKKYLPKLCICAYHRNSDMFKIPLMINGICPEYKIYFYHHRYIPAWESNFYGIVK